MTDTRLLVMMKLSVCTPRVHCSPSEGAHQACVSAALGRGWEGNRFLVPHVRRVLWHVHIQDPPKYIPRTKIGDAGVERVEVAVGERVGLRVA